MQSDIDRTSSKSGSASLIVWAKEKESKDETSQELRA